MTTGQGAMLVTIFSIFMLPGLILAQEKQTPAEDLVGKLPPGLLGFLATSGSDDLKTDFDKSDLGKTWHEPSVQTFYTQVKDQIWTKVFNEIKDPKDRVGLKVALSVAKLAARSPSVIAVGMEPSAGTPKIHGFLLVGAGARRTEIADNVSKLEGLAKPGELGEVHIGGITLHTSKEKHRENEPPMLWGWVKDYFVVVVNDEKAGIVRYLAEEGKSATTPAAYQAAIAKVPGTDDAKIFYLNVEKIGQAIAAHARAQSTQPAQEPFRQFMKELGLDRVESFIGRSGFAGPDAVGNTMLTVNHPAETIFSNLRSVDLAILDLVPADAIETKTSSLDFAGLYDRIMAAIKAVDPEKYSEAEKKIAEFEGEAKVKVRQGLLENLAGPVLGYTLPSTGMVNPLLGNRVHLMKLRDAKTFQTSLETLERFIVAKGEGKVQATVQKVNGQEYHIWVIPQLALLQVSPCWTIQDRNLVIAPNITGCQAAVNHATTQNAAASSIRTVESFKRMTKDLPGKMISFRYADHKAQAAQSLQMLQQFWPMIALAAQQKAGMQLPMLLPPITDVTRHMGPEVDYAWFVEDGIRSHHEGAILSPSVPVGVLVAAGIGASVATPAFSRGREMACRAESAANLRQIGLALTSYATQHNDTFPASLQQLLDAKLITPKVLESPLKPREFAGPSYVLVPVPSITAKPGTILAYENPAYQTEGTNVLHVDASVSWEKPEKFMSDLQATYAQLGKPMPPVQFGARKEAGFLKRLFRSEEPTTTQESEPEED